MNTVGASAIILRQNTVEFGQRKTGRSIFKSPGLKAQPHVCLWPMYNYELMIDIGLLIFHPHRAQMEDKPIVVISSADSKNSAAMPSVGLLL